jgi:hypothetical protein
LKPAIPFTALFERRNTWGTTGAWGHPVTIKESPDISATIIVRPGEDLRYQFEDNLIPTGLALVLARKR